MNSPFSSKLIDSCGGGLQDAQLDVQWILERNEHVHLALRARESHRDTEGCELRSRHELNINGRMTPTAL